MNTIVKGLRYTEQGMTAWNNDLKQLAKVALHLGEPSVRLEFVTYRSLHFGM